MRDNKYNVRYLGFRPLADGGRRFDFSLSPPGQAMTLITVEAPLGLFTGPDHIAIQEGAGICYETLKCFLENGSEGVPGCLYLTSADVAQHRKFPKAPGRH